MSPLKRVAASAAAATLAAAALAAPSGAATKTHWTKSQCKSYVSSFHKKHPHATSGQKSKADKELKAKGCTVKV